MAVCAEGSLARAGQLAGQVSCGPSVAALAIATKPQSKGYLPAPFVHAPRGRMRRSFVPGPPRCARASALLWHSVIRLARCPATYGTSLGVGGERRAGYAPVRHGRHGAGKRSYASRATLAATPKACEKFPLLYREGGGLEDGGGLLTGGLVPCATLERHLVRGLRNE